MASRLKVMTLLGTRPEIIRLSRVIAALERTTDHVLVHTGQNYDRRLNEVFFEELGLRPPDHHLGVATTSLGRVLGEILIEAERVLLREQPDAVLILGDTNSSIAAVMAKRLKIPVFHMEAGNRSFDPNVPEEVNRRLVDHVADYNLVYTEHARRNLLAEGLHPASIILTGSPLREVVDHYREQFRASAILEQLAVEEGGYFLVSAHREENVDDPERLADLLDALDRVAERYDLPVLVSTHPRTRKAMERLGREGDPRVRFHEPFGFFDYVALQAASRCVLSDSGTISEESAMLDFPAITLRDAIERPEAVDAGGIVLSGVAPDDVLRALDLVLAEWEAGSRAPAPAEYGQPNTSSVAVRAVLSLTPTHHARTGVRRRPGSQGPAART